MQLAITRDDADRIVAIRVRMDGTGVRKSGRRLRQRLVRGYRRSHAWIESLAGSAWHAMTSLAVAARTAIPHARVRRDSLGRPQAVVLQFGPGVVVSDNGALAEMP